ncbi:MAG: DUF177 domain-containing protein [Solirubrobacterales bacterium]
MEDGIVAKAQTAKIELRRLSLSYGEGTSLDLDVPLDPLELGGQTYRPDPELLEVRLDVSRLRNGYALRLRFSLCLEGPCMRCLDAAVVETEIDAREVDQQETEDEELRSPYVIDEELDVRRWAHDAAVLAVPARILCRPDCAGLCPICGESLNEADPAAHEHDSGGDPRWAKLRNLELE